MHSIIRRFTVQGEDTIYRERLTYFSETDREYAYTHLEGIHGVKSYAARLKIEPTNQFSCDIIWTADIEADEPRASEIAEATRDVFEDGIDAIVRLATPQKLILESAPSIALTVTAEKPGPLCLFLHGIGGKRQNWDQQLIVAGNYMQAAAMDLRGYGESALGSSPSTIDDYCKDILRVMQALKKHRVVLCGLSYGSWIATSFAMRHSDRLSGLVLSGGCTGMSEASVEERENFRITRELPLNEGKTPADFARSVVNAIAGPHATADAKAQLHTSMAAISVATYRDALQCFTSPREYFDFSRITSPVLLMTGEHDRLAPPSEIRAISNRIHTHSPTANVRFEIIPNAGHVCNIENAPDYNNALAQFLAQLSV